MNNLDKLIQKDAELARKHEEIRNEILNNPDMPQELKNIIIENRIPDNKVVDLTSGKKINHIRQILDMNKIDTDYQNLLKDILENGTVKQTRNGGTLSVFGRQIRHKMSDGFPLLTTKKMPFKTIVTELLWFLRGDTNIKFLVDNDCHIWDGDAYKRYVNHWGNPIDDVNYDLYSRLDLHPDRRLYTKEEFVERIKTIDEFAKTWGELGPVYGKQWRGWKEFQQNTRVNGVYDEYAIDQIANLITDLKTNPDSRRLMVNAWNVGELDQMVLPPCHYGFQVYTRELSDDEKWEQYIKSELNIEINGTPLELKHMGTPFYPKSLPQRAISLMWNQRSVDTFLGLPFNIASYGLLLEIIAKAVNMVPDELIGNLGDVHLYSNHIEQAKEQIGREPNPLPTLNINTEFWPTESGECGVGPINTLAVLRGFSDDNFCKCLLEEDLQLSNYQSHPPIKAPLSN